MDTTKLRYTIKAIFTPAVWFRNEKQHPAFDRWLWDALQTHPVNIEGEYTAEIAGAKIWISNAPYANGHVEDNRMLFCGRATALLLQDVVKAIRVERAQSGWREWEKAHGLAKVNR